MEARGNAEGKLSRNKSYLKKQIVGVDLSKYTW